jgi:anti-anti-sigma regulatory factor
MDEFSLTTTTPAGKPVTREVAVSGTMTIHHAAEIKEALLAAFAEADDVRMELTQVTEIDLVGLQLLHSAHQTSVIMGKRFASSGSCGKAVTAAMERAGFSALPAALGIVG